MQPIRSLHAPELIRYHESNIAILVGTATEDGWPELTHGWGAHVLASCERVTFCIERAESARSLVHLTRCPRMSASFAQPPSFRAVQLEGRCAGVEVPRAPDLERAKRHRANFCRHMERAGISLELALTLWSDTLLLVQLDVQDARGVDLVLEAGDEP